MKGKIDIVYTWVDGNDEDHVAAVKQFAKTEKQRNPERYRDAYDMLKYSFTFLFLL